MDNYSGLRKKMVEEQLIPRGIHSQDILNALYKVERHKFVPKDSQNNAYGDFPVAIGEGQTISQPYIVALMTESLDLNQNDLILEIGTGSGYQTAILAELVKEVYSIERFKKLAIAAKTTLDDLGYKNVYTKTGDGTLGWPEKAPFDKIIITAAAPYTPLPLIDQLKENGLIILPLGESFGQTLTLGEKKNNSVEYRQICGCVFVPLIGKFAYPK